MDKKQAIINTIYGKIQARSKRLFEDVNDEIWAYDEPEDKKDYDLSIDGEDVKEEDEEPEAPMALDVILDAPVDTTEKDVKEF